MTTGPRARHGRRLASTRAGRLLGACAMWTAWTAAGGSALAGPPAGGDRSPREEATTDSGRADDHGDEPRASQRGQVDPEGPRRATGDDTVWGGARAEDARAAGSASEPEGEAASSERDEDTTQSIEWAVESSRVELGAIAIEGVTGAQRKQVAKVLAAEGLERGVMLDLPDDARVARARARLVATGFYSRVTIAVVPRPSAPDDPAIRRADLRVELVDRGALAVPHLILGGSRAIPFRGGVELLERNLFGRGLQLGGGLAWGTLPRDLPDARRQQAYRVGLEAPRLGGSRFGVGGAAWVMSANELYRVSGALDDPDPTNFRVFDYDRIGGRMGVRVHPTPALRLSADYRIEGVLPVLPPTPVYTAPDGSTSPIDLELHPRRHLATAIDLGLRWDGRSDLLSIGQGARLAADLSLGSTLIGSRYEFARFTVTGGYSFRLPWRHFLSPMLGGGQVVGVAPRFERFATGDVNDWTPGREMGLLWSTRHALDVLGTGVDELQLISSYARADLEYAIPLFRFPRTRFFEGGFLMFSIGAYVVAGNAADRARRVDAGRSAVAPGLNGNFGLRLETSIGPIDLTIGNLMERLPL